MTNSRCNRYRSYLCLMLVLTSTVNLFAGAKYDDPVASIQEAVRGKEYWEGERRRLRAQVGGGYKSLAEYAVALMHLGQAADAIGVLRHIEAEHPGEYSVAASLGTAYELTGQDEKALLWIKECIVRNAHSHQSTEWLHVRILHAKIEIANDPDWLSMHTVTGLDFGNGTLPAYPPDLSEASDSFRRALIAQLSQRVEFAPAADPVVANLLFDLGNVLFLRDETEAAIRAYEFALTYSPHNEQLVRDRNRAVKKWSAARRKESASGKGFASINDLTAFIAGQSPMGQLLLSLAIAAFMLLVVTVFGVPFFRGWKRSQTGS